jgi:hypothetical protein
MIEVILIAAVAVIIGVNVLTTVSTRFRRWLYTDYESESNDKKISGS